MKKVSVIIPIYKGKKYVNKIFEQIEQQTCKNLEVIFIDDGSGDGSAEVIADKIAEIEDKAALNTESSGSGTSENCYKIISQSNTGQGGARNRGIKESTGDYLLFMDQDDYIKSDYIERLLEIAERDMCDIVISGYEHVTPEGGIREHVELVNNDWCRFMNITPWGKIYRRDFVVRENIRFLPVPLGEDIYFNVLSYSHAGKVSYTDYVGYQWVINDASVSNTVHKSVSEESDILILFDELAKMDTAGKWMRDETFRFFMLKTGIFHILYAAKATPYKRLLQYRTDIFKWLNTRMSGAENNKLVSWNGPEGERAGVRHAIYIYMLLRKMHLDGAFLWAFHLI